MLCRTNRIIKNTELEVVFTLDTSGAIIDPILPVIRKRKKTELGSVR
jgi:hypothetical protein